MSSALVLVYGDLALAEGAGGAAGAGADGPALGDKGGERGGEGERAAGEGEGSRTEGERGKAADERGAGEKSPEGESARGERPEGGGLAPGRAPGRAEGSPAGQGSEGRKTAAQSGTRALATASMGGGVIAADPASALDLHVDLSGEDYALGLGGRLHYTASGGFRSEDWDEIGEFLGLIRYARYDWDGDGERALSAAAGELGDVHQGSGAVVAGYSAGLRLDRGRFGAQARGRYEALTGAALIDNFAKPRIFSLRSGAEIAPGAELGVSFSADLRAPAAGGEAAVGIAALEGELGSELGSERFRGRAYFDAASASGLGAGLHLGAGGSAKVADSGARVRARGELRLAHGGYIPGWFGPLYERDRVAMGAGAGSQLDLAREGDLGGAAGLGEVGLDWPGVARGAVAYAGRPELADHWLVRVEAPFFELAQGAVWAVLAEGDKPGSGGALAAEVRAKVAQRFDVSLDVSRLYRDEGTSAPSPAWKAIATFGVLAELGGGP